MLSTATPVDEIGIINNRINLVNGRLTSACEDENGDPIFFFDETTMESCIRTYTCNSGYKVKVQWKIVTQLPLIAAGSKGRVRLKNPLGTIVHSNTNITPVTVTPLAETNANFPASTVYRITYESPFIDQTIYNNASNLENGVLLATDCSTSVPVQFLAINTVTINGTNGDPCLRVDPISINPPSGVICNTPSPPGAGILGSIAGTNAFGQCSVPGYTPPNSHEVLFTAVSGGAVTKTFFMSSVEVVVLRTCSYFNTVPPPDGPNLLPKTLEPGTYIITCRNLNRNMAGAIICAGGWSAPLKNGGSDLWTFDN